MSKNDFNVVSGDIIGGYVIVRELGRGNNGIVYLARQRILERMVACKVLMQEYMEEPGYAEAFFREARTAALISHPNIVQALDVGNDSGKCFFIMEYVDGEMLEDIRISKPELLTPKFLLNTAIQLAGALEYAWNSCRMIHGDIKPENIMIQRNGNGAKLADLGLARVAGSKKTDEIMATPLYVAPEVITQTADADPRSDIYSFGVMLYELSCGEPPFNGKMEDILEMHISKIPDPILKLNPDMNRDLAQLIDRMIAKSPDDRPQSWHEIRVSLEKIRDRMFPDKIQTVKVSNKIKDEPVSAKRQTMPLWMKIMFAILTVIAILTLTVVFGAISTRNSAQDPAIDLELPQSLSDLAQKPVSDNP